MTTTTTITPQAGQLPAFTPQAPAEGWSEYGRRAMLYALQLPAPNFAQLDNDGLQAGADACNHAMAVPGVSDTTIACLTALQRELRARLTGRRAETARRLAGLQAEHDRVHGDAGKPAPAAAAGDVPPAGPQGPGGGSKVRKPAGPRGPVPPAFQLPEFDLADAF